MQRDSILFILKSNGVKDEDINTFSQKLKDKSFTIDDCDKLLVKLGYEKIFVLDEDDFSDNLDDNFLEYEKNKPKKVLEQ